MKHYPKAIILPPKVYYYQPKIFGFKIFGKKGSKYYKPVSGNVKYTEDEEDVRRLVDSFKKNFRSGKLKLQLPTAQASKGSIAHNPNEVSS